MTELDQRLVQNIGQDNVILRILFLEYFKAVSMLILWFSDQLAEMLIKDVVWYCAYSITSAFELIGIVLQYFPRNNNKPANEQESK